MKKQTQKATPVEAPARKKLALKKDTLKDLAARQAAKKVKAGGYTPRCNGSTVVT